MDATLIMHGHLLWCHIAILYSASSVSFKGFVTSPDYIVSFIVCCGILQYYNLKLLMSIHFLSTGILLSLKTVGLFEKEYH